MSGGYGEPQWATPSDPAASTVPDVAPNAFTSATENPTTSDTGLTPAQAR